MLPTVSESRNIWGIILIATTTTTDGGFGGPIRMLLDDAGVDYEYNYIPFHEEFLTKVRHQWVEQGHPFDCAPMIELDGKRYGASQPIIRFLSKKLGKH